MSFSRETHVFTNTYLSQIREICSPNSETLQLKYYFMCIYIHIYMCVCVHIYVYIYIYEFKAYNYSSGSTNFIIIINEEKNDN